MRTCRHPKLHDLELLTIVVGARVCVMASASKQLYVLLEGRQLNSGARNFGDANAGYSVRKYHRPLDRRLVYVLAATFISADK